MENKQCECGLCERLVARVTRHHLVPRTRSRKRKRRGQTERFAAQPAAHETVDLCRACHGMIHAVLTEKELEADYHSVAALLGHPRIAAFVTWVAKQSPGRRVTVRWTRDRHEKKRRS